MKGLWSFQVAAGERGHIWEEIDQTCHLCCNLVIIHCRINALQIENSKSRQEWNSLFLVSRNWRGCCLSWTEKLLLSSVVCSGMTKGETFKSNNENQEPKSHWLLMKVRGRRFCCASEISSFSIVQVAGGGWDLPVPPFGLLQEQKLPWVVFAVWPELNTNPLYLFPWGTVSNHTPTSVLLLCVLQSLLRDKSTENLLLGYSVLRHWVSSEKRVKIFPKLSCSVVWEKLYLVTCRRCCKGLYQAVLEVPSMYLRRTVLTGEWI